MPSLPLGYSGEPKVIISFLIRERREGQREVDRCTAGFEDGEKGPTQKNAGSLWKLEKAS